MSEIRRGDGLERFELPPAAEARLASALQHDLAEEDALEALTRAVELASAFDGALGSPSVAARVRTLILSHPQTLPLLRSSAAGARGLKGLFDPPTGPREARRHRDRVRRKEVQR